MIRDATKVFDVDLACFANNATGASALCTNICCFRVQFSDALCKREKLGMDLSGNGDIFLIILSIRGASDRTSPVFTFPLS